MKHNKTTYNAMELMICIASIPLERCDRCKDLMTKSENDRNTPATSEQAITENAVRLRMSGDVMAVSWSLDAVSIDFLRRRELYFTLCQALRKTPALKFWKQPGN